MSTLPELEGKNDIVKGKMRVEPFIPFPDTDCHSRQQVHHSYHAS
jgi:hypothetical protein